MPIELSYHVVYFRHALFHRSSNQYCVLVAFTPDWHIIYYCVQKETRKYCSAWNDILDNLGSVYCVSGSCGINRYWACVLYLVYCVECGLRELSNLAIIFH